MFDWLIAIFIGACATFYIPGMNFHEAQNGLFKFGVATLFIISLYMDPIRKIRNAWLNSFAGLALLSIFLAKAHREIMIEPLVIIFLVAVLFYLIVNYVRNYRLIYGTIGAVVVISAFFTVMQFLGIDPLTVTERATPNKQFYIGLFGHPMNAGIYMSLAAGVVWWPLAIVAGILALASKSWISVALAMGVLGMRMKKRLGIAFLIICILVGAYAGVSKGISGHVVNKFVLRYEIYKAMLAPALKSGNFLGYGLGTFPYIAEQVSLSEKVRLNVGKNFDSWNDYIGYTIQLGFAALVIMLGLFWSTIKDFLKMKKDRETVMLFTSLVTIPVGIFFHSYFDYVNTGVICLALYAIFCIKKGDDDVNKICRE